MDLFDHALQNRMKTEAPLAARMRGILRMHAHAGRVRRAGGDCRARQAAVKTTALRRAVKADRLFSSIILWGPPGTGKTTLADGAKLQR